MIFFFNPIIVGTPFYVEDSICFSSWTLERLHFIVFWLLGSTICQTLADEMCLEMIQAPQQIPSKALWNNDVIMSLLIHSDSRLLFWPWLKCILVTFSNRPLTLYPTHSSETLPNTIFPWLVMLYLQPDEVSHCLKLKFYLLRVSSLNKLHLVSAPPPSSLSSLSLFPSFCVCVSVTQRTTLWLLNFSFHHVDSCD